MLKFVGNSIAVTASTLLISGVAEARNQNTVVFTSAELAKTLVAFLGVAINTSAIGSYFRGRPGPRP